MELKHRRRIDQNYLAGITFGQWRRLLRENRFPELAPEVREKVATSWRRAFEEWVIRSDARSRWVGPQPPGTEELPMAGRLAVGGRLTGPRGEPGASRPFRKGPG